MITDLLTLPLRVARAVTDAVTGGDQVRIDATTHVVGSDPARWADEVVRRTSAPGRLRPTTVRADAPELLAEPFVFWGGSQAVAALIAGEVLGLRQFFAMGGISTVIRSGPLSKPRQRRTLGCR